MGNTYEVWAFWPDERMGDYQYTPVYQGESLLKAVLAMWKAKKTAGCVKLEWR